MELLLAVLLATHLMCVNVASGGPLVAACLDWRSVRGDARAARSAAYLGRVSLVGLLVGAGLGLFIGWLKWDESYAGLWLGPMSYKLKGAVIEAVFSLVLTFGWWLWLPGKAGGSKAAMGTRAAIAVLAATNLLYHFPLLFSVATRLRADGATSGPVLYGAEFRQLLNGEAIALMTHVALASLAMAGTMLMGLALRWMREGNAKDAEAIGRTGARWALVPSLLQLPVGLWTLMALSPSQQSILMGENALGILLLVASLAAAAWLLNDLAQLCLGDFTRPLAIRAMAAMLVTVVLMTVMQQFAHAI